MTLVLTFDIFFLPEMLARVKIDKYLDLCVFDVRFYYKNNEGFYRDLCGFYKIQKFIGM